MWDVLKLPGTVFRRGRTLLDQGCPNFAENFFGASVHEKNESIFWLLGCLKNAENVKIVRNQFFEGI